MQLLIIGALEGQVGAASQIAMARGANAIANNTGRRFRDLPLTRQRIKAAIGV